MIAKRKALAYILRTGTGGVRELLVFSQRGRPEAGIQVPGGTVEEGEDEVRYARSLPDTWSHRVKSAGEDNGLVFDFFWMPLERADVLAGQMGRYRHDLGSPGT